MTNVRTGWMALIALGFIASPACGDTTGDDSAASGPDGVGGTETGGVETAGVLNGGMHSDGSQPSIGGTLAAGGNNTPAGGSMSYGGLPVQTGGAMSWGGGYPTNNTGGGWNTGGVAVAFGGYPSSTGGWWSETGGAYSEPPPNGATCLCRLAESLMVVGGWQTAGCTSDDPNNCTLEKAYCGQTCAADANCALSCFADFPAQVFNDAATYSYGSCNVIIRCPAPSS